MSISLVVSTQRNSTGYIAGQITPLLEKCTQNIFVAYFSPFGSAMTHVLTTMKGLDCKIYRHPPIQILSQIDRSFKMLSWSSARNLDFARHRILFDIQ